MLLLTAACAHRPPPPVPEAALHPRSIAIIPVLPAEELTLDRASVAPFFGGIAIAIERIDRSQSQDAFRLQHDGDRAVVAASLTTALVDAARRRGFDAVVLDNVVRDAKAPDDFDFPHMPSNADVIVHVRLHDIGVFSRRYAQEYESYVDMKVRVVARVSDYEMLDEDFHVGVNGSRDDPYSIPTDSLDRWPDLDAVMAQPDRVGATWRKASDALAARIISTLPPAR